MIGIELVTTVQLVYFSYIFNTQPSFMMGTIEELQLVTGIRSMFYREEYENVARGIG